MTSFSPSLPPSYPPCLALLSTSIPLLDNNYVPLYLSLSLSLLLLGYEEIIIDAIPYGSKKSVKVHTLQNSNNSLLHSYFFLFISSFLIILFNSFAFCSLVFLACVLFCVFHKCFSCYFSLFYLFYYL